MPKNQAEYRTVQFEKISDPSNNSVDKSEKQSKVDAILPLPTQLVNYRNKNYFVACIALALGSCLSLYVNEWAPVLLCSLFTAFFLWKAITVANRFNSGKIAELIATCTGVIPSFYRDRFTVTFAAQSKDGEYAYYKFIVPNKRMREEFVIGAMYIIYFDRDAAHSLLGSILLSSGLSFSVQETIT